MRVPLSWLREFVDLALPPADLAEVLTLGGLEVTAVLRATAGVTGVRIGEVLDVAPIAGSDKLHLVHVTVGEEPLELVCGASNFGPGDRVAVALPGATLPFDDPEQPVEVGRKRLFGVMSNGMLASARELGVGDDHRGIWVLEREAPVGADLRDWLKLDDAVLELDVTPDRGYALSVLGVARDVAALTGAELRMPDPPEMPASAEPVPVAILDPDRCRRFDARTIRGVRVGPSPSWLQVRLAAAGMRPVSNIVDATNHTMLETGNPIHAYDLALLAGPRIEVRTARPGETLRTLDGVERVLDPDDLLICDADGPVALAGVMGGEATEINDATTDVLLEVANFSARTVLRTARRHRLHTEGSSRWEKQVPPATVPLAAARCAALITRVAGGEVVAVGDTYPAPVTPPVIRLRPPRARAHLGLDLDEARQATLLQRIDCEVRPDDGALAVTPPAYRPDLEQEADLYEELARLHGYDQVPEHVPSTGQVGRRESGYAARQVVRRALAGGGWTEVMPFPFIAEEEVAALGLPDADPRRRTIALVNPLSKEEAVLRTTLLPGLLRVLRHNVNRQVSDVAVFEIGRVFLPPSAERPGADGGPEGAVLPAEPTLLGLAATGAFEPERHDRAARQTDLYDLLGAADLVRDVLGHPALEPVRTTEAPFHPGRAARLRLDGADVGVVGELHPRVCAAFEVPPRTQVGELDLERLAAGGVHPRAAVIPSALPGLRFDVAVLVDEDVPAAAVEDAVRAGAGPGLSACTLFDVYRGPAIEQGRKSLAYRVQLDDPSVQLTDADEAAAIERIAAAVARIGGQLRR